MQAIKAIATRQTRGPVEPRCGANTVCALKAPITKAPHWPSAPCHLILALLPCQLRGTRRTCTHHGTSYHMGMGLVPYNNQIRIQYNNQMLAFQLLKAEPSDDGPDVIAAVACIGSSMRWAALRQHACVHAVPRDCQSMAQAHADPQP